VWRAYTNTGVIHCVFDLIPDSTKLLYHPPGGNKQINTCRQVPLQVNF
jgi:hypothetical protein